MCTCDHAEYHYNPVYSIDTYMRIQKWGKVRIDYMYYPKLAGYTCIQYVRKYIMQGCAKCHVSRKVFSYCKRKILDGRKSESDIQSKF